MDRDLFQDDGRNLPASQAMSGAEAFPGRLESSPMPPLGRTMGTRETLTIAFKHKYKILLIFILGMAGAAAYYHFVPRLYQSSVDLIVRSGWEYRYSPEVTVLGEQPTLRGREIQDAELSILNSDDLKARIISTVGLQEIYPQIAKSFNASQDRIAAAIKQFGKDVTFSPRGNSGITASLVGRDPVVVAHTLNRLIDYYKAKRLKVYKDDKSTQFLEQQLAEERQQLRQATAELQNFKKENGIIAFDTQRNILLQQRMRAEDALSQARNELSLLQHQLSALKSRFERIPKVQSSVDVADFSTGQLQNQLLILHLKLQELLSKYKEPNLFITEVRRQIQQLKGYLVQQKRMDLRGTGDGPQNDIRKTQVEMESQQTQIPLLIGQIDKANKDLQVLNGLEGRLRSLENARRDALASYQSCLNKLQSARVYDQMDRDKMTSVNIIEPATINYIPIRPHRGFLFFLVAGAALGLAGGIGLAYLFELADQTFTTPEDAEKGLGLTVLATIPLKE